jgi:hypothetical protein
MTAQADTVLNFDVLPAGQLSNTPIAQTFGDNTALSTNGITIEGFGTPNVGLLWQGTGGDPGRWVYYLDSVWSAAQLHQSAIGSAHEIIFRPDNPTVSIALKSFKCHPRDLSNEKFTYELTVMAGTNVVHGPIPILVAADGSKNHLVAVDYTGAPGQTLILRLKRVASALSGTEIEGGPENLAIDDLTFAQLPARTLTPGLGSLEITSVARAGTNLVLDWVNGTPPFQLQIRTGLTASSWIDFGLPSSNRRASVPFESAAAFARVVGQEDPDYSLPMGVESWYLPNKEAFTAVDVTNLIDQHFLNGMPQLGYRYYILDDFWQGGRTNGHLAPNPRFAFALTNGYLAAHLHSKGVKLVLYTENSRVTSAGNTGSGGYSSPTTNSHGEFPIPRHDYYAEDTADFISWGVDGVKFDPHAITDWNEGVYEVRQFSQAWRQATRKPLWLMVDITVYQWTTGQMAVTNFEPCIMFPEANALRLTTDTSLSVQAEWALEETLFTAVERWGQCACPGHFMYLEHAGFIGQNNAQYFELGKATVAMRAMMATPIFMGTWNLTGEPDRWFGMTNANILRLAHDPNYQPATRVISNAAYHAWSKQLSDGTMAVTLWNRAIQVGAATNCTIWWTNLGFASEQRCAVFNCWSNRLETVTTNSFTALVTNISAETFFIYATNGLGSPDAAFNQNGSARLPGNRAKP